MRKGEPAEGGGRDPGRPRPQGRRAPLPAEAGREPDRGEAVRRGREEPAAWPSRRSPSSTPRASTSASSTRRRARSTRPSRPTRPSSTSNPKAYRAAFNLAKLLQKQGRREEARALLQEGGGAAARLRHRPALPGQGAPRRGRPGGRRGVGARGPRPQARAAHRPPGHYVLADVYNRQGRAADAAARGRGRRSGCSAGASDVRSEARARGEALCALARLRPSLAGRAGAPGLRAAAARARATSCSSPSTPCAPTGWAPTATSDVATPHLDRIAREGAMAERGHRPRAPHPALARHALHGPPARRDRHPRQHLARGRARGAAPRRDPEEGRLRDRRLRLVGGARARPRASTAASTPTTPPFEGGGGDAQFLSTVQKKGDLTTRRGHRLAREDAEASPARPSRRGLPVAPPLRPPRSLRAARALRHPLRGTALRRRGGVRRRARGPARRRPRPPRPARRDACSSSPRTTARGWASTARRSTASSPTRPRCACPSSSAAPGSSPGTRLESTVRLVDVFPTVLDLLGRRRPPKGATLAGTSLAPALRGERRRDRARDLRRVAGAAAALRLERPARAARGPLEVHPGPAARALRPRDRSRASTTNLLRRARPRGPRRMRGALGRFLDAERKAGAAKRHERGRRAAGAAREAGRPRLRRGRARPPRPRPRAPTPRTRSRTSASRTISIRERPPRFHDKDYAASVARFEAVLKRGISSFEVHFYLARGLVGLGRRREAAPPLRGGRAPPARLTPRPGRGWPTAASPAATPRGALDALRKGEAALPKEAGLRLAEARLLQGLGRKTEARAAYEAALPLAPKNARARAQPRRPAAGHGRRRRGHPPPTRGRGARARGRLLLELPGHDPGRPGPHAPRPSRPSARPWRLDDKNHHHAFNLGLALCARDGPRKPGPSSRRRSPSPRASAPARAELAGGLGPGTIRLDARRQLEPELRSQHEAPRVDRVDG